MDATSRSESLNISCNNSTFDREPSSSSQNDGATCTGQAADGNGSSKVIANSTTPANETSGFNTSAATTTTTSATTNQQESSDQKLNDDSSTFSTAFTISFDDDSNASKKLGIKDSIRKYAPPKPLTIEKPRPPKSSDQGQDYSLMSIESAPAGLSKLSPHKSGGHHSHSSRSSSRRSNSSRHSNLSESAAFLIDKMLDNNSNNNKQVEPSSSSLHYEASAAAAAASFRAVRSPSSLSSSRRLKDQQRQYQKQQQQLQQQQQSMRQMTYSRADSKNDNNDLDHCEDKSDNGTYIVGTDPESEAARRKIDELFGVVKAAEASVIAETALRNHKNFTDVKASTPRQSRLTDKKPPLNRERQEHINRLAYRKSPMSRSSSSSRPDNISSTTEHNSHHEQRVSSHHSSRTSSRDRTPRAQKVNRPRRSASQSSRQSSNREFSDGDTRSSRSSLHNDTKDEANLDCNSISSHPNMKFNRAFALRRARLGLGEPSRVNNQTYSQDSVEQATANSNVINSSQRRHQINTNTYKAGQSTGSANFSRDDGGRFSLRMKSNALSGRLVSSAMASNRSPQHSTGIIDSYLNRVPSNKSSGTTIPNYVTSTSSQHNHHHYQQPQQQQESQSPRHLTKLTSQQSFTSTGMPYQSGDELDATMSPSRYWLLQKAARNQQQQQQQQQLQQQQQQQHQRKITNEFESDTDSHGTRFNNTFASDYEANNFSSLCESRAGSSATGRHGSASQLGALDSLVISAISSLSLKIRHSVCDVLVEHAKKLPAENETRLIVEEILPQLVTSNSSRSKSPTSIEEIDQSLYFDLAQTLKNLKKVEQMVDVINLMSDQLPPYSPSSPSSSHTNSNVFNKSNSKSSASSSVKAASDNSPQQGATSTTTTTTNLEGRTSLNDLSSV